MDKYEEFLRHNHIVSGYIRIDDSVAMMLESVAMIKECRPSDFEQLVTQIVEAEEVEEIAAMIVNMDYSQVEDKIIELEKLAETNLREQITNDITCL